MGNGLIKVQLISNEGAGTAENIGLQPGTTVGDVVRSYGNGDPNAYTIKVNRLEASPDYVLQDNDRISLSPKKIAGAR